MEKLTIHIEKMQSKIKNQADVINRLTKDIKDMKREYKLNISRDNLVKRLNARLSKNSNDLIDLRKEYEYKLKYERTNSMDYVNITKKVIYECEKCKKFEKLINSVSNY